MINVPEIPLITTRWISYDKQYLTAKKCNAHPITYVCFNIRHFSCSAIFMPGDYPETLVQKFILEVNTYFVMFYLISWVSFI